MKGKLGRPQSGRERAEGEWTDHLWRSCHLREWPKGPRFDPLTGQSRPKDAICAKNCKSQVLGRNWPKSESKPGTTFVWGNWHTRYHSVTSQYRGAGRGYRKHPRLDQPGVGCSRWSAEPSGVDVERISLTKNQLSVHTLIWWPNFIFAKPELQHNLVNKSYFNKDA